MNTPSNDVCISLIPYGPDKAPPEAPVNAIKTSTVPLVLARVEVSVESTINLRKRITKNPPP
jgi:hypothetical protein